MGKYIEAKESNVKKPSKQRKPKPRSESIKVTKRKPNVEVELEAPPTKKLKLNQVPLHLSKYTSIKNPILTFQQDNYYLLKSTLQGNEDLFSVDEQKGNFENLVNRDILSIVIDEISLEGLDGITIEAFGKRLNRRWGATLDDDKLKKIWPFIRINNAIDFFILEEPRAPLQVFDRFSFFDHKDGIVFDHGNPSAEIYPFTLVNNVQVRGSCSTFDTRRNATEAVRELSFNEIVDKFGSKLVMVANETCRKNAIECPSHLELQPLEYCILERIGRSRDLGELTQGSESLATYFHMDPKTVFYYNKQLIRNELVSKQAFYLKSNTLEQNKNVNLLHLRRFYQPMKSVQLRMAEEIMKLLKSQPGHRMAYPQLKSHFPNNLKSINKLFKSLEFQKYFKTDRSCLYRDIYPNAHAGEWRCKANGSEKLIKILELRDPFVNLSAVWGNEEKLSDDEGDTNDVVSAEEAVVGKSLNCEFFREVYLLILSRGKQGIGMFDIQKRMDLDLYIVRIVLKKLLNRCVIDYDKVDNGKQRNFTYYASCIHDKTADIQLNPPPLKVNQRILDKLKAKQRNYAIKSGANMFTKEHYKLEEFKLDPIGVIEEDFTLFECEELQSFFEKPIEINEPLCEPTTSNEPKINFDRNYSIPLTFWQFLQPREQDLIKALNCCYLGNPKVHHPVAINKLNIINNQTKLDYSTKCLLLRAMFNEISLATEIDALLKTEKAPAQKRKLEATSSKLSSSPVIENQFNKHLNYMGDHPEIVHEETENNIAIRVIRSTKPEAYIYDAVEYPPGCRKFLTDRVYSRINCIIRVLNEKKIVEDANGMLRIIEKHEKEMGYHRKIDRKSLCRINSKLVCEGYIKIFKIMIFHKLTQKVQIFVCHPSIEYTHSTIQSQIEQMKLRWMSPSFQEALNDRKIKQAKIEPSPFKTADVRDSIVEMQQINQITELRSKYNKIAGRIYGFKPKFVRTRIMHEFLFYTIYNYQGQVEPLEKNEVLELFAKYKIQLTEEDLQTMPPIYCSEISWKMFIPRLRFHPNWTEGWSLLCDQLVRLPLSVFVKLHNTTYDVQELREFVDHPIKRYYLLKDLPCSIRTPLLYRRKYVAQISDICKRLAFMGLLQFGPEKYKEKEQLFIYLNRSASLFNTTPSKPAYNKVNQMHYERIRFVFNASADVEEYWYQLYTISVNTKLNARKVMDGKTITITDVSANPSLMRATEPRSVAEAVLNDTGDIPGDNRGAAGMDSAMWCHIIRNWLWATKARIGKGSIDTKCYGLREDKLSQRVSEAIPYEAIRASYTKSKKVYLQKKAAIAKNSTTSSKRKPTRTSKTNQRIVRKISVIKMREREYLDNVDKQLRSKFGGLKMIWDGIEDKYLVLAKAACYFLTPNTKKQVIPYYVIRDAMHRLYPKSANKSAQAVRRRLLFMQQKDKSMKNVPNNFQKLFENQTIHKYFSKFLVDRATKPNKWSKPKFDSDLYNAYVVLISFMWQHLEEIEPLLLGKNAKYDLIVNFSQSKFVPRDTASVLKFKDVVEDDFIRRDVVKSVVHSSLRCQDIGPSASYQLFKVYQNFPDTIIRSAVTEMKSQQIISTKKKPFDDNDPKGHYHMPFQLSVFYSFSMSATFGEDTATEAFDTIKRLMTNEATVQFDCSYPSRDTRRYGQMLGLNEMFVMDEEAIAFNFQIPVDTLILNSDFEDHTDLIEELAVRWQLKSQKKIADEAESVAANNEETTDETDLPISELAQAADSNADEYPLDLTLDGGFETISRLKSWVSDCMSSSRERRSPSPEFLNVESRVDAAKNRTPKEEFCFMDNELNVSLMEVESIKNELTLEEIKSAMLEEADDRQGRTVPYITSLYGLLGKDSFPELGADEETLERFKKHFTLQYPKLMDVSLNGGDIHFDRRSQNETVWHYISNYHLIKPPNMSGLLMRVIEVGGTQSDCDIAVDLLEFIYNAGIAGAKVEDINSKFASINVDLNKLVEILIENSLVLKAGICTLAFVHHKFQSRWLIETSTHVDDPNMIAQSNMHSYGGAESSINDDMTPDKLFVHVMPWVKYNGVLHEEELTYWLCMVLSHCLEGPAIPLQAVFEKFSYVKPVDVYFILEVLQLLDCIELRSCEPLKTTLTSTYTLVEDRKATILDDFGIVFVHVNGTAMTILGSFLMYKQS